MNRPISDPADLLVSVLGQGNLSGGELRLAFQRSGYGPSTLHRAISAAGDAIVSIGRGRATRYASTREVRGLGRAWPLLQVDEHGVARRVATLHALVAEQWWVESHVAIEWLALGAEKGFFAGLPWYLDGLRPDGFLGRHLARQWAPRLRLPPDLREWSWDDVLTSAVISATDMPGDLLLGNASDQSPAVSAPIPVNDRPLAYARLAAVAMAGDPAGSSAGGEQPKFLASVTDGAGKLRHVLVKFSPPLDQPAGQRWADLLRCEHHALQVLAGHGFSASSTAVVQAAERLCLEVERFDRTGKEGRRGFAALSPLAHALGSPATDWRIAAEYLHRLGWLSAVDSQRVGVLQNFGRLIGNTDMHLGNLSVLTLPDAPFALAPVYDMLPMFYRPETSGEIVQRELDVARLAAAGEPQSMTMAAEFWRAVASDPAISSGFAALATSHAKALASASAH